MTQSQAKSAIASVASSMNKKNAPKQRVPEDNLSAKKDILQEDTARQIIAQMIETTEQTAESFMSELQDNDYVPQQKNTAHIASEIVQNAIDSAASVSPIALGDIPEDIITLTPDLQNQTEYNSQDDDSQEEDTDFSQNNAIFQNKIIDIVRENIEKIHNHSFAFADNIHDSRIAAVNAASMLQETALDGMSNISNACLDAASKSVACEKPTDFISNQMECASKIHRAYSDMFSTIGKESYKTWRETFNMFIMPKC